MLATTGTDKYVGLPPGRDPRFVYNAGAIAHIIVTSNGVVDSGGGSVGRDSANERYMPFERTRAVGTFVLVLPSVIRQFDYETIADAVLHVAYTAREGGSGLRSEVEKGQLTRLNALQRTAIANGLYVAHSLKRHWYAKWFQFVQQPESGAKGVELTVGSDGCHTLRRWRCIPSENEGCWREDESWEVVGGEHHNGRRTGHHDGECDFERGRDTGGLFMGTPAAASPAARLVLDQKFRLAVADTSDVKISELVDIVLLVHYSLKKAG